MCKSDSIHVQGEKKLCVESILDVIWTGDFSGELGKFFSEINSISFDSGFWFFCSSVEFKTVCGKKSFNFLVFEAI